MALRLLLWLVGTIRDADTHTHTAPPRYFSFFFLCLVLRGKYSLLLFLPPTASFDSFRSFTIFTVTLVDHIWLMHFAVEKLYGIISRITRGNSWFGSTTSIEQSIDLNIDVYSISEWSHSIIFVCGNSAVKYFLELKKKNHISCTLTDIQNVQSESGTELSHARSLWLRRPHKNSSQSFPFTLCHFESNMQKPPSLAKITQIHCLHTVVVVAFLFSLVSLDYATLLECFQLECSAAAAETEIYLFPPPTPNNTRRMVPSLPRPSSLPSNKLLS